MSICVITHPPFAREYKIYLYCKLRQYVLEWTMTAVFISIVNRDNICGIRKIKILLKPTYCGLISI